MANNGKVDPSLNGNIETTSGLIVRKAVIERARPFKWAWEGRILIGYINLIIGEEGIGKGNLFAWVAARVTKGELPGALAGKSRKVAIIGDEDSFDHVWVPRLKAANADLDRVQQIVGGPSGGIDMRSRSDVEALTDYVATERVRLIYFDQLLDNLGVTDTWKDKQVRDALRPLSKLAKETRTSILVTLHPNKRGGSFRQRLSGTPAFNALSRSSMLIVSHPHIEGRVVMVRAKGNYAMEPPAFDFKIEEFPITQKVGKDGVLLTPTRVTDERDNPSLTADLVIAAEGGRKTSDSKAGRCRSMLAEILDDGKWQEASVVMAAVLNVVDVDERAVKRAAKELEVERQKKGFPAVVHWRLPSA